MSFKIPSNKSIKDSTLKFMLIFPNVCLSHELKPLIDCGYLDSNEKLTPKGKKKLEELRNLKN